MKSIIAITALLTLAGGKVGAESVGNCRQGTYIINIYEGLTAKYEFRFEDAADGRTATLSSKLTNPEAEVLDDGKMVKLKDSSLFKDQIRTFIRLDPDPGAKCNCGQYQTKNADTKAYFEEGQLHVVSADWIGFWNLKAGNCD